MTKGINDLLRPLQQLPCGITKVIARGVGRHSMLFNRWILSLGRVEMRRGDPLSDSRSFLTSVDVFESFFNENMFSIGADVGNTGIPVPFVKTSPDWQIYQITNFMASELLSSADFSGPGRTESQFVNNWGSYITASNGSGFGGPSLFGAWFVDRNIPADELGSWIWNADIAANAQAIPEPATGILLR